MDLLWWCVKALCGAVAVLGVVGTIVLLVLALWVGPKSKIWL